MKQPSRRQPCVGLSARAENSLRALSLETQIEVLAACNALKRRYSGSKSADDIDRTPVGICALRHRSGRDCDYSENCGKVAIWVEMIEITGVP